MNGRKLVTGVIETRVGNFVPLKNHHIGGGLMRVKSVYPQSPYVSVEWTFEEGVAKLSTSLDQGSKERGPHPGSGHVI
ncbi:hypothetical protein TNCV_427521 [Trichonephila clavipes]|nr:hypothetical protein TNCV_427521 [Trichonephila clavipes]